MSAVGEPRSANAAGSLGYWMVACVCGLVLAWPPADAGASPSSRVLGDCARHQGVITGRFSRSTLAAAYKRLRLAGLQYQDCGQSIASRQASFGRHGRQRVAAVIKDCLYNGGRLTHAYGLATLRRAYRGLNRELRSETRCPVGIASQLNGLIASHKPVIPAKTPETVRPHITEAQTLALLARTVAAFARPAVASDTPSPEIRAAVQSADATSQAGNDPLGADADQARAIGAAGANMFAIPAPGEICAGLQVTGAAALSCHTTPSVRFSGTLTLGPGGLILWGLVPDGNHAFRLLTDDGHWRALHAVDNGLDRIVKGVPRLITWRDRSGVTHYQDYSELRCVLAACPG